MVRSIVVLEPCDNDRQPEAGARPGWVRAMPREMAIGPGAGKASDLVCLGLTYWEFRPLVQHNATIAWNLLQTLARRLRTAQDDQSTATA